jgi:hypothetical protein
MPGRITLAVRGAKRLAPVAMEAYRRWDRLSPAEKERHKERARTIVRQTRERVRRGR